MPTYRSHKGVFVDMDTLKAANAKQVAAGNMRVNARGDLLGKGGKILKTREQLVAENEKIITAYNEKNPNAIPVAEDSVVSTPLNVNAAGEMFSAVKNTTVTFKDTQKKTDLANLDKFDVETNLVGVSVNNLTDEKNKG